MKIFCHYLYTLTIILTSLVLITVEFENEVSDVQNCANNLSPYQITTSFGPKTVCAYVSTERVTWKDAKFRCNLMFARLTPQIHFKSSLRTDLIRKGIDILWIGIHRRNDFFVTEYPSKLFREVDSFSPDYWGYHWSEDEPGSADCVSLNVSDGSLQTHKCDDILPFVCDEFGKDFSNVYKNISCPEGWTLSFPLSSNGRTCIFLQEPNTHGIASEFCRKDNGRLAAFKEYTVLSTSKLFSFMNAENFWIKKRNLELCEVTRYNDGHMSKIFPIMCTLKYPSICVKHFKIENIKAHITPTSIKPVPSYSENAADLLTCNIDSEFSGLNFERDLLFQWYKDDLPISANSYVMRLRYIGDALKRDPYISDIASRQGYYNCEVQLPGSNEKFSSQKMKISYTDISTYFIEIRGIKETNGFDYSHQRFSEYMEDFEKASINNIFEKIRFRYPESDWDFVSKRIVNGETVMKIVVYILKSEIKDFNERLACEALKDSFKELYSIPVFMDNISAYINCEEFPVVNADIQIMKNLQNIEDKLTRIEHTQEYILKKLQESERSPHIESEEEEDNFDVETFVNVIEELKDIDFSLLTKRTEDEISEDAAKRYIAKAKDLLLQKNTAQHSKSEDLRKVKKKNIYNSSKKRKETASNRIVYKDL